MLHVCSYIVALCYSFTDILSLCATVLPVRCHSVLKFYRYIVTLCYSFTGILSLYATVLKVDCHSGLQFYRNIVTLSYSFTGFLSLGATVLQAYCRSVLQCHSEPQYFRHIVTPSYIITQSISTSADYHYSELQFYSYFVTQCCSTSCIPILLFLPPTILQVYSIINLSYSSFSISVILVLSKTVVYIEDIDFVVATTVGVQVGIGAR